MGLDILCAEAEDVMGVKHPRIPHPALIAALLISMALIVLFLIAAPAASAATGLPGCGNRPTALKWEVIRGENGRRAVGLRSTGQAAAIRPIQVLISRRRGRGFKWTSLESQYRYRARRREVARFGAVFVEDRSGYGNIRQPGGGVLGLLPLQVPVVDLTGLVGFLGGTVRQVLPNGLPLGLPPLLDVLAPQLGSGTFAPDACLRVIRKTVD